MSAMNEVQSYISSRPHYQAEIMTVLRSMVLDTGPHVQEKVSYTVPYFYFHGPLCYLSPKPDGVYIGFVHGNQLSNEEGMLEAGKRKFVRAITFHSLAELEEKEDDVRKILNEAAILNEYMRRKKAKK
jgi:hypothetical protein